MNINS
jgi:hypothetical protein